MSTVERVAIVYDCFAHYHQAERVIEEIAKLLPRADLLSTACVEELPYSIRSRGVKASWMDILPARKRFQRQYLALHPLAIRGMHLSGYNLVISSGAGFAKGAPCPDHAVHVCYCHGPTPAIWRHRECGGGEMLSITSALLLMPLRAGLRKIDAASSSQPDYYIASSYMVAGQIKRCYGRNALVIHPPVDTARYHPSAKVEDYYLIVSSLTAQKRIDMVIAACNSRNSRLLIVGDGPDRQRLEVLSGPTVKFLGNCTESEITDLIAECHAVFCFDADEGFDTMPLKANASGRPAIALSKGTALETILDGESGVLYEECSRPAIVDAMKRCGGMEWKADELRRYAQEFDASAFRRKLTAMLEDVMGTNVVRRAIAVGAVEKSGSSAARILQVVEGGAVVY